ncbi:NACHT LRR and PYD domains-containing protein 1 like [Dissostichus eleginoides]|uniref:NACHT LRR and PYD domains-containing protein 1 like n=1 Tax=Dissostichus eleginoides TaxID=100907 RepID=A0AAD9C479_DISEL|nr:NACHT LRR and PYD domains-containing protein 1 like [Dissostichus eleginoides]
MEVESMMAQKILLESLNDLSSDELNQFKSLIELEESFPLILRGRLKMANTDETVDLMVKTFSGKCVNMTETVLKKMNRTDLVQRLSDISSGTKEEPLPSLIQSVETMALPRHLTKVAHDERQAGHGVLFGRDHSQHRLLEMTTEAFERMNRTDLVQRLSQSSSGPKKKHSEKQRSAVIQKVATMAAKKPRYVSWIWSPSPGRSQTVEQIIQIFGQQCVEITMEVLKDINRTDLRQRLTKPCSELKEMYSVDEHRPAQSEGAPIAEEKEILLKTLKDLSGDERYRFQWLLQFTYFMKSISFCYGYPYRTKRASSLVNQMVKTFGPQSLEVTKETILRLKDKHPFKPLKKEVTVASLEEKLLETLKDLSDGELENFKRGLQRISSQRLETAGRVEIVDLMVEIYGQQSMEVTMEILKKMKEDDYCLEQMLSNITLGSKGPSRSLELEGSENMTKDSSDWTKLEPEVNSTDEDEPSTYSLKSEAGNFECSVSGLRWVCQEKVSFKYQFCSSEEPMKRMEMMKYMPAGPLIDITVISGKLFEVYLPHWICIDDIPEILQKFAVLHIDDCGDVVEKVSEVTSSHVKLSEPVFSPRTSMMKMGFPVKIHCNVLIYSKAYASCTVLHVYLIPLDPALKETMDKKKKDFKFIQKPHPNKCLKMYQDFNLTADITAAQIGPEKITLRYDSQDPNFYEVYIENPHSNFQLTLSQLNKGKRKPQCEPVWSCEIRKVDLRNPGGSDVEHSSDEMPGVASFTTKNERLLKMLKYLEQEEFKEFKWFLRDSDVLAGLPRISCSRLENSDILDLVDLMSQTYSQKYLEVTKKIFKEINRNDLVQKLSDIGSGSKVPVAQRTQLNAPDEPKHARELQDPPAA